MTVSTNDIIRVNAIMTGPSGRIENVFHFRANNVLSGTDSAVMLDLAQFLDDTYTAISGRMTSDTIFVEVQGFNVTTGNPLPTVPWPTLTAGTGGATDMPAQVAGLGILRTGVARAIGRKFFGGLNTLSFDANGFLTSPAIVDIGTTLGNLTSSFIGASTLNTYLPGIRTVAGLFWGFLSVFVKGSPAVQRRRGTNVGI